MGAPQIASSAFLFSRIGFSQISSIHDESSALLPAAGENVSPALLPSSQAAFWSPESALANHTRRTVRFDETHANTRWSSSDSGEFILVVNYEFPMVLAERNAKAPTWIKYGFIQFFAFFLALAYIFGALTDLLFESGVFVNYAKIEKIQEK